jgi:hypothetical protein
MIDWQTIAAESENEPVQWYGSCKCGKNNRLRVFFVDAIDVCAHGA